MLPFTGLLMGLGFFSYHVRELLVCWLFLGLLFAVLVLAGLGILLVGYAGHYFFRWMRAAATVVPVLVVCPPELHPEVIPASRILLAGSLDVAADLYPIAAGPEALSGSLIAADSTIAGMSQSEQTRSYTTLTMRHPLETM